MKRHDGRREEGQERVERLLRHAAAENDPPEGIAARAMARRRTRESARLRKRILFGTAFVTAAVAAFVGLGGTPRRAPGEGAADDFIRIAPTLLADSSGSQIAAAAENQRREANAIDPRLAHPITVRVKGTALSDLCTELRDKSGIRLDAGASVADEKITLLCADRPLREVMRALSRPFGYTWVRSGKSPQYRYELVQDLKSQLLEEELRNRDRHAALLALEKEIERYRPYLGLSPDEAHARVKGASPAERKLLVNVASYGWGPLQVYFRLTPRELAALRAGQRLTFRADPKPGEQPLPTDIARGVLQSLRGTRIVTRDGRLDFADRDTPGGLPPAAIPEARAVVNLRIDPRELGQFTLDGESGVDIIGSGAGELTGANLATGLNPTVRDPRNVSVNEKLARDPALRARVTLEPEASCAPTASGEPKRLTSADVLEALHRATGLPIVADYYTRLYLANTLSLRNQILFEVLNHLADSMRLRWDKDPDGVWLRFRSVSYYDDRLKEVPNRLLSRWTASRRQHGALTLEDLVEIAGLSDVQLDSQTTAEGAKSCFGLAEWDLAKNGEVRPHLRFLGRLTPAQRKDAIGPGALRFAAMSLPQQQQFVQLVLQMREDHPPRLEELAAATLRIRYTQLGGFEWKVPDINSRAAQRPSDRKTQREPIELSPFTERTREAALLAARRIDSHVPYEEIVPTELAVTWLYTWGRTATGLTGCGVRITPNYTSRWDDTDRSGTGRS